jgi:hypothetical protein
MKSLAACMLLLGVASSTKVTQRLGLRQTLAETEVQANAYANTCDGAIRRAKAAPTVSAVAKLAASTTKWTDATFTTDWSDILRWSKYPRGVLSANPSRRVWRRITDQYPNAALFGSDNKPDPAGIAQGSIGDCYWLAAASAMTE